MPKKTKDKKPKAEKVEVVEKTEWDEKTVEQIEEDKRLLLEQIQDSRSKRNYFEQERVRNRFMNQSIHCLVL